DEADEAHLERDDADPGRREEPRGQGAYPGRRRVAGLIEVENEPLLPDEEPQIRRARPPLQDGAELRDPGAEEKEPEKKPDAAKGRERSALRHRSVDVA